MRSVAIQKEMDNGDVEGVGNGTSWGGGEGERMVLQFKFVLQIQKEVGFLFDAINQQLGRSEKVGQLPIEYMVIR